MATMEQIRERVRSEDYAFLQTNRHLGNNVILLGVGGSHAYGTSVDKSDIDLRGIALNTKSEILGSHMFQAVTDEATDTVIFSVNKAIDLLSSCNPNALEMLGLRPEHYLHLTTIGEELIANRKLFLSKLAVNTFGGYANGMLKRMENEAVASHKMSKHMMHAIRLYLMGIDVLEKEEIVTYREDDLQFLLDVRSGSLLTEDGKVSERFYELINEYETRLQQAVKTTTLPDRPDYNAIMDLRTSINERVVLGNAL